MKSTAKIIKNSTAFFCCDVQERFRPLISNMPSVIFVARQMMKAASILDIPVFVTEQYPKALGNTVPELELPQPNARVYDKTKFSMLIPKLEDDLKSMPHINTAVLFGIEAHVCILQTTKDLLERGYNVHIVADGTSSQRQWDRSVAFSNLRQSGAYLTTAESVLFQLVEDATHPQFKQISALCKEKRPDPGLDFIASMGSNL